jgi:serine/threonine protein kinase
MPKNVPAEDPAPNSGTPVPPDDLRVMKTMVDDVSGNTLLTVDPYAASGEHPERAATLAPGARIASYEIVEHLASGGMGHVYKARRVSDGLVVALKVMSGALAHNPKLKQRFLRETKTIASIAHENVVRFIDSGLGAKGEPFLVMELIDGEPLDAKIKPQAGEWLSVDEGFRIFRQIASGLAAAHACGVIHRDVKPPNIMLTRDGTPKVTDFGVARRENESMLLTNVGQVVGSPAFMSPEQALGQPVDARTDVYSLGATLYWLCTGHQPFPRATTAEILQAHVSAPRPDVQLARPEVPVSIARLLMKLLAIDANERPRDAGETVRLFDEARAASASIFDTNDESNDGVAVADRIVGPYIIEGHLGAGGMATVHLARHEETKRACALKLLPTEQAKNRESLAQFLLEGELSSLVNHPNVVHVEDHGQTDDGRAYIELELIEGTSLDKMVSLAGPLEEKLLISVARGCARALQAIAAAGIVHRDVKPENVLLAGDFLERDDAGVKLIDFGLALRARTGKTPLPGGTPPYMSPEQLANDPSIDTLADLYSLGATLYFAATGAPPYEGKTPAAVSLLQQQGAPRPVRQINPAVSLGMEALIDGLLERNRDARLRSAEVLLEKLEEAKDGKARTGQVHKKYTQGRMREDVWKAKMTGAITTAPSAEAAKIAVTPPRADPHKTGAGLRPTQGAAPATPATPPRALPRPATTSPPLRSTPPPATPLPGTVAPAQLPPMVVDTAALAPPEPKTLGEALSGLTQTQRHLFIIVLIAGLIVGFVIGRLSAPSREPDNASAK